MVDKLRYKSEEELKHLYLILFQKDLEQEWIDITKDIKMNDVTEEMIIAAILSNRYKKHV